MKKVFKYATKCDFGKDGRADTLGNHSTYKIAINAYARLWKIYGELHGWKVWLIKL